MTRQLLLASLSAGFLAATTLFSQAADCSQVRNGLRSIDGSTPATLVFVNQSPFAIRLEWADYNGALVEYGTVQPGQSFRQETFLSHPWVATNMPGDCLAVYLPNPGESQIVMAFAPFDNGEEQPPQQPIGGAQFGRSLGGIVRSGPGMQFPKLASLAENQPIAILGDTGVNMNGYNWFEIEWNGRRGYQWGGIMCSGVPMQGMFDVCR
ncbi:MAG: SH3 domain-containing protein [Rhizobiaceae bacterium]